jgi:hypothetical protein
MEHVVFYSENPGEPEFRRVGDLDEAVRLVEKLRNDRGISDVSLHALTPIPVSFRTYYRVEVAVADPADAAPDGLAAVASADAPEFEVDEIPSVALEPVPALEPSLELTDSFDSFASFAALPEPALDSVLTLLPPPVDAEEFGSGSDEPDESAVSFLHSVDEVDEVAASEAEPTPDSEADEADEADEGVSFELPHARPESEPERSLGYFAH